MPYEHGATIGYSMIVDDIKTIEDAINEAVDDMKTKKEEHDAPLEAIINPTIKVIA